MILKPEQLNSILNPQIQKKEIDRLKNAKSEQILYIVPFDSNNDTLDTLLDMSGISFSIVYHYDERKKKYIKN